MAALEGLLGGMLDERQRIADENFNRAYLEHQRESRIYETLLNSPDPEIQSAALTGLLSGTSTQPGKGVFAKWFGQQQSNPAMGRILELLKTPVAETTNVPTQVQGPPQAQGYIGQAPPAVGSAAQVPTSPTAKEPTPLTTQQPLPEGLAAAPPDLGPVQPDQRLIGAPPSSATLQIPTTRMVPRHVIQTPAEAMLANKRAAAQGDVEGEVAGLVASGFSEPEARDLVKQKMIRATRGGATAAPFQAVAGEAYDEDSGKWTPTYANFNRATGTWEDPSGNPIKQFRKSATGGSPMNMGMYLEAAAGELGFANAAAARAAGPDSMKAVTARAQEIAAQRAGAIGYERTAGVGNARFNTPMDVKTAMEANAQVGATPAQYAGQQPPTQQEEDRRRSIISTQQGLAALKPLLTVLPRKQDTIGGLAPGAILNAKRMSREDREKVAQLEAAVESLKGTVSYGVQLNRGQSTEGDMRRAEAAIVDLSKSLRDILSGDTQESALSRIHETEQALNRALGLVPAPLSPTGGVGQPPPAAGAAGGAPSPGAAPSGRGTAAPAPGGGKKPYDDGHGGIVWR